MAGSNLLVASASAGTENTSVQGSYIGFFLGGGRGSEWSEVSIILILSSKDRKPEVNQNLSLTMVRRMDMTHRQV